MIQKSTVIQIVNDFLLSSDTYLVDVKVGTDNRILVEIDAFDGITIDQCVELSKFIESKLDREVEDYELEVGSAGLTEPFKVLKQYEKCQGEEVEVLTATGIKHTGILIDVEQDHFKLEVETTVKPEGAKRKTTVVETITFNYKDIKTTKRTIRFK